MLNFVFSNSLRVLAQCLSQFLVRLYAVETDLSSCSLVVVQSEAMASYVRREMALAIGVCANLQFCDGLQGLFESYVLNAKPGDVVWSESYLFSVLYPYFLERGESEDIAVSWARTHAEKLLRLGYERPQILKAHRDGHPSGKHPEIAELLKSYDRILAVSGGRLQLPDEKLNGAWDRSKLPSNLYIFDPAPLSSFELKWLYKLAKHTEVHVFAFSPCEDFWEDVVCSVKDDPLSKNRANETDENAVDAQDNTDNGQENTTSQFLLNRCGRISHRCARDWNALLNAEDKEFLSKCLFEGYVPGACDADCMLKQIQRDALSLGKEKVETLLFDESLILLGFEDARAEVAWIADRIMTLCQEAQEQGETLPLESIAVLVPQSLVESYGVLMRAELVRRGIPHNMHALISQPLEMCFSAFTAFVSFLISGGTRESVLNWAFHPGICEHPEDFDRFAQVVDILGIYGGLDAESREKLHYSSYLGNSEAFTWAGRMEHLVAARLHTSVTLRDDNLPLIEGEMQTDALVHWQRISAMLYDHGLIHEQRLGYTQWRDLLYGLFDTWLLPDVMNREMAMDRLWRLFVEKWPSDYDSSMTYDFQALVPLLRVFVRQLMNEESGRITGGVQVRPLTCDVFSSKHVFLCGQDRTSFPAAFSSRHRYDYAQEDIDAHAWMKWLHNAEESLCVTATAAPSDKLLDEKRGLKYADLSQVSVFMADLAEHIGCKGIVLYTDETCSDMVQALKQLRRSRYMEGMAQNQSWAMKPADFGTELAAPLDELLNGAWKCDEALSPASNLEKSISWKALADMVQSPRKTWRQHYLKINEYWNETPRQKSRIQVEPIELVHEAYQARTALSRFMGYALATGQTHEEVMHAKYDDLVCVLRSQGLFPDKIYAELSGDRGKRVLQEFQQNLELLKKNTGDAISAISYQISGTKRGQGLLDHWFDQQFACEIQEIDVPAFHLKGVNGNPLSLSFTDPLPIIMRGTQASAFVMIDCSQWENACLRAGVAACLLVVAGIQPPEYVVSITRDGKSQKEIRSKSLSNQLQRDLNRETAMTLLTFLSQAFVTGHHELEIKLSRPRGKGLTAQLLQSPLQRYLGDESRIDLSSQQHWEAVTASELYAQFLSLYGL